MIVRGGKNPTLGQIGEDIILTKNNHRFQFEFQKEQTFTIQRELEDKIAILTRVNKYQIFEQPRMTPLISNIPSQEQRYCCEVLYA